MERTRHGQVSERCRSGRGGYVDSLFHRGDIHLSGKVAGELSFYPGSNLCVVWSLPTYILEGDGVVGDLFVLVQRIIFEQ